MNFAAVQAGQRQGAEKKDINGGNLLIAIFREPDSYAVYLLEQQGITRFDIVNYVSHGISKTAVGEEELAREMQDLFFGGLELHRGGARRAGKDRKRR